MVGSSLCTAKVRLFGSWPSEDVAFRFYPQNFESLHCQQLHFSRITNSKVCLKNIPFPSRSFCSCQNRPVYALTSEGAYPINQKEPMQLRDGDFEHWDSLTAKFAGAANLPFLLLQLPQIVLNSRNLMGGNKSALQAVPWLGMLTGLIGNLSLLSYFIKKGVTEAVVVQLLGVVSMYVVVMQLALAEAMPFSYFIATSMVIASGFTINLLKHFHLLNLKIWRFWEDFTTVGGLTMLPQVMWSTFIPYVPESVVPGSIAFVTAVLAVFKARRQKLISKKGTDVLGTLSGWTATFLFMWMPVAQMWTNLKNPENIKGLSTITMLLVMLGNGLLIPRALFIRDFMWFVGSFWACVFYGWGNLVSLYRWDIISRELFLASTFGFLAWIGMVFWRDGKVRGHGSPMKS